eukprot:321489-Chlamydomonas_euryale.AAC.3
MQVDRMYASRASIQKLLCLRRRHFKVHSTVAIRRQRGSDLLKRGAACPCDRCAHEMRILASMQFSAWQAEGECKSTKIAGALKNVCMQRMAFRTTPLRLPTAGLVNHFPPRNRACSTRTQGKESGEFLYSHGK